MGLKKLQGSCSEFSPGDLGGMHERRHRGETRTNPVRPKPRFCPAAVEHGGGGLLGGYHPLEQLPLARSPGSCAERLSASGSAFPSTQLEP